MTHHFPSRDYQIHFAPNGYDRRLVCAAGSEESDARTPFAELTLDYEDECKIVVRFFGADGAWTASQAKELHWRLYPVYAEWRMERQQYILRQVIASIRSMTSMLDVDVLLNNILEQAMMVIPWKVLGTLWMYDGDVQALKAKASVGKHRDAVSGMMLQIGEGIVGKTFRDGQARWLRTAKDVYEEAVASTSDQNLHRMYYSGGFHDTQSVISVPVFVDREPACVLIFNQYGDRPQFTSMDFQLLQSFADQLSIVLMNARLFRDLNNQNALLVKRDQIHASLMKLSLQSKGSERIVQEMGKLTGLPLLFIDSLDNKKHASRGSGPFRRLDLERLHKQFDADQTPGPYSQGGLDEDGAFYIQPIVSAEAVLGFIIADMNRDLTPLDHIVLEQGSSILALEMVLKQSFTDSRYKRTSDMFNEMLLQNDLTVIGQRGKELGLEEHMPYLAALIVLKQQSGLQMQASGNRLVELLRKAFVGQLPVVFVSNNKVTALLAIAEQDQGQAKTRLEAVLQEAGVRVEEEAAVAGMGSVYRGLLSIQKSYTEAGKALGYLESRKQKGVIRYVEIGVNRLFLQQPPEQLEAYVQEVFEPLRGTKADASHLEETLLMYIACSRSTNQTAARLHIHVNTLYLRLKRIEELLELSFHNPEHLLRLELAWYLRGSPYA
ncbi:helix-turn-helix domain-containing protein [Paenibacillus xanthanilyticus]